MTTACRLAVCTLALLAPVSFLHADDTEHREFSIDIDGKPAGVSRITIVQKDDGTAYMTGSFDVKFRHLVIAEYTLKVEAQEWWKDGKLVGAKTKTNDNGKKTDVVVGLDGSNLRLSVNGVQRVIKPDMWTSSYWKLADKRFHNNAVSILETDSGKEFNCELKYLGTAKQKVGNDLQECYHFRVSSAPGPVDLWFDRYHRLVRQEFTESGHKTVVQLINIRR
jgi:Domain of unknown function (DUF6134)